MKSEIHERARKLLAAARVEGISTADSRWLSEHLADCTECSSEATSLAAAIQTLRSLNVMASADSVRRASLAVQHRAAELRLERERKFSLFVAAATSCAWAAMSAPLAWSLFGRVAHMFQVPESVWLLGFVLWWFLPATVLGAVIVWRRGDKREPLFELGDL